MNSKADSSGSVPRDYSAGNFSSNSNHSVLQPNRSVSDEVLVCGSMEQGDAQEAVMDQDTAMTADRDTSLAKSSEVNCYLNEPMLIRESTDDALPQKIVQFYGEVEAKTAFGALAVLVKVLMNELGYVEADRAALLAGINGWAEGQSFRMDFIYPALEKSTFSLLLLPVHCTLFIHGLVHVEDEEPMNVKLHVSISDVVNSNVSDDIYASYKGSSLPKFSRTFKDCVAHPLLQYALTASGFCSQPSLLTLVSELQIAIFKYLDVASLLRLSGVCVQLNGICRDRAIWRHLIIRDFGVADISASDLKYDWRHMYKEKYVQMKRLEKERARLRDAHFAFCGFGQPPVFAPPPVLPFGGEEDLFPLHYDPNRLVGPFHPPPGQFYQPPGPAPQAPGPVPQPPFLPFPRPVRHDPDLDPSYSYLLPPLRPVTRQMPFSNFGSGMSFRFN